MVREICKYVLIGIAISLPSGAVFAQDAGGLECRLRLVPLSLECLDQEDLKEEIKEKTDVFVPEAQVQTYKNLEKLKVELDKKAEIQVNRTKELHDITERIERKLNELQVVRDQIEAERKERMGLDEKDISKLVLYYEKMEPENSATFINQMDSLTAAHILMRINPRKGSKIMELLDVKVAVSISENLAGFKRNQEESDRINDPNKDVISPLN